MTTPDPKPTIGRIVHFRPTYDTKQTPAVGGDFHVAGIVTMTPEEWTPGWRDADDEWHETTNVTQPKKDTVHLHVFYPFGASPLLPTQVDPVDVPYGDGPGTWSWPPKV